MTPIADLIRRLEAATGPDRSLDAQIAIDIGYRVPNQDKLEPWMIDAHLLEHVPRYTGSIDAALPGEDIVTMYKIPNGFRAEHCEVNPDGTFKCYSADAKTEPLARRIAALRARAADNKKPPAP